MTPLTKSSTPESYKSIIRNKQKKQSRTKRKAEYKKAAIRFEWITAWGITTTDLLQHIVMPKPIFAFGSYAINKE